MTTKVTCETGEYSVEELGYEQTTTIPITFDELHRLVSEVDYINDESYPIEFSVDGVKYRAGIGPHCLDDFQNVVEDSDNKEYYEQFTDFFYGYEDEVQYLSRIEDEEIGEEYILDACDPDGMSFKGIGEMLKKSCNITESSRIGLFTKFLARMPTNFSRGMNCFIFLCKETNFFLKKQSFFLIFL